MGAEVTALLRLRIEGAKAALERTNSGVWAQAVQPRVLHLHPGFIVRVERAPNWGMVVGHVRHILGSISTRAQGPGWALGGK